MRRYTRIFAASLMALSLSGGIAAAADQTGSNGTTGPNSHNVVINKTRNRLNVDNDNRVNLTNHSDQVAGTGNAAVRNNTTGGDATSGTATNSNSTSADIMVDNSGAVSALAMGGGGGSQSGSNTLTGPSSHNVVVNKVENTATINNDNNITVRNSNLQSASSGNATVSGNTTGGSATSGDAMNTNTSDFSVSVSN